MTDTNFFPEKYFGKIDPICETTTLAGHYMTFPVSATVYDNNIYYLMSYSNQLYVFDLDGNYVKTISLQFEDNYNPPFKNIPERSTTDIQNEVFATYKKLSQFFVLEDKIIVSAINLKHNKETLKMETTNYITIFDKEGNRLCNTLAIPLDTRFRQINDDKLLVIESRKDGSLMLHWLDINSLIKK